jgi:ERCC4-type nuclease
MGKGYKRFKREIIRSQESNATLFIIVEGSLTEVGKGFKHSQIKGSSMKQKLYTLWIRHGIQTIFTSNRKEMAEYITQLYLACGREHIKKK